MAGRLALLFGLFMICAAPLRAQPVGEIHRTATAAGAVLRDAAQRDQLRLTIWYPAATGAREAPVVIGPPGYAYFDIGSAAPEAPVAPGGPRPAILLSHGFGGSARMIGWFGIGLARAGYVVIAVDHPGSNAIDPKTVAGAIMWWERAEDLRAALQAARKDTVIGPHIDAARLGVAGFSAGGLAALIAGGARVDWHRIEAFCAAHPDDGVCRPQEEFAVTPEEIAHLRSEAPIAAAFAHSGEDHSIPGIRAVFAMAPGVVQALDPASLAAMRVPLTVVLGDADDVAPPATNGLAVARLVHGAKLIQLPGVGHYDFLGACTEAGRVAVPVCRSAVPQKATHARVVTAARELFGRAFAVPVGRNKP